MANEITDDMLRKAFKAEDKALGLDKLDDKKALQNIFDKAEKRIQKTGGGGGGGDKIYAVPAESTKQKMGEEAHRKRLQGETGAMGRGGGGGGGMKPDTDITASKKLPKMAKGGSVSSASKRADGCAMRGKTKGRMV